VTLVFNNIAECDYIDASFLTYLILTQLFFHINMRSINNLKNFDALHEFLTSLPHPPDIICISETCLKGEPLINISLTDYKFIHTDLPTNAGG